MRPSDFELLVCRTTGLSPSAIPAGLIEEAVRQRAANLRCKTLYSYGERLETSASELQTLISDVEARIASAPSTDTDRPEPEAPTSLALARLDPRFRRRRTARAVAPLREPLPMRRPKPAVPKSIADAREIAIRALARDNPSARALVLMALIREADGASDDAAACYRLALRQEPMSEEALHAFVAFSARRLLAARSEEREPEPQKLA